MTSRSLDRRHRRRVGPVDRAARRARRGRRPPAGSPPAPCTPSCRSSGTGWSSTWSAEMSSLSWIQVTTARTWPPALSGERSEQAAVGLPVASVLEFETRPVLGRLRDRRAEVRGHLRLHRLERPRAPSRRNPRGSADWRPGRPSRARLRAVRGIRASLSSLLRRRHIPPQSAPPTWVFSGRGVVRRGQRQPEPLRQPEHVGDVLSGRLVAQMRRHLRVHRAAAGPAGRRSSRSRARS